MHRGHQVLSAMFLLIFVFGFLFVWSFIATVARFMFGDGGLIFVSVGGLLLFCVVGYFFVRELQVRFGG